MLKTYSVPIKDERVCDHILKDLFYRNKKNTGQTTMKCFLRPNAATLLVHVPALKDLACMQENNAQTKWFEYLLSAIGGLGTIQDETLLVLLNFIARSKQYGEVWTEAVRLNGYPVPRLDAIETKAIQFIASLNNQQIQHFQSCFIAEFGSSIFLSDLQVDKALNLEHVVLETGEYAHGSKKFPWAYK